ncbi:Pentatricopeptide repeat-containing protein [Thalictrum thalictroides]|uniref:Pentatricopeptide repeat-containing protein n=1 Tax=Thalictrum thalictroides TaxID=46969 RepID=A0A7J6W7G9_THATH|nr:Pentatricopeptide repeat-containing protein [Thalictrum thalictroides]
MSLRDTVVWNSMISGYTRAGFSMDALSCFRHMQRERVKMDSKTIPSILSACGREGDFLRGKEVHGRVVQNIELKSDIAVGNALIDMYAKCGCLDNS